MKNVLLQIFCAVILTYIVSANDKPASQRELFVKIDTVQISPDMRKMVIKYFGNNEENENPYDGKLGRFEAYYLGDTLPFQIDSVSNVAGVNYEDANFDSILDIKILTREDVEEEHSEYYTYNTKTKKFEFFLEGTELSINKKDKTIHDYWFGGGRSGNYSKGKVYRCSRGKPVLILEKEGDNEFSYQKELRGDSLVFTEKYTSTHLDDINIVDSTWTYLFDMLRLDHVTKKTLLDRPSTKEEQTSGQALQDARGNFLSQSEESFEYQKNDMGIIICKYHCEKVRGGKWIITKERKWQVRK